MPQKRTIKQTLVILKVHQEDYDARVRSFLSHTCSISTCVVLPRIPELVGFLL